jgi:hypothetical protein
LKKASERLTYANVVSSICLFLLLSGATAFAAVQLGKNSVGSKQLKKSSVTGAKVKNHSLTGKDIKLSKLGKVPLADHAVSADTASALSPPEAIHLVGAPGEPPFLSGSMNGSAIAPGLNLPPVGFYKDHEGVVHLEGIAKAGTTGGASGIATVFNLPPGFRPQGGLNIFAGIEGSAAFIAGTNVAFETLSFNGGDVAAPEEELVVLSGITFRAAN